MKCPVCGKEVSRPIHISKSKDEAHISYVESQKKLAEEMLLSGIALIDICNNERIIMKSTITDYLYLKHPEKLLEVGRANRNEKISKSKTKAHNVRREKRREIEKIIETGIDNIDYVTCQICNFKSNNISTHVTRVHKLSAKDYKLQYQGYELFSKQLKDKYRENMIKNNPNEIKQSILKMKKTKALTKEVRIKKAKLQFANGERKPSNNTGRGVGGFRPDLGHYCRSMWEANVARILKLKEIEYEYEKEPFPFYDENGNLIDSYLPDFYLPKYDAYLEVKGQMDDLSKRKIDLFKQHGKRLIIVEEKMYNWIVKKCKNELGKRLEYSKRNVFTHSYLFKKS